MQRRRPCELSTTSYAVLGMLAVRPSTGRELALSTTRHLGRLWPRARGNLFNEPRKLLALGLVTTSGNGDRNVYTITAKGRAALDTWLAEPGDGPTLEFEQLVKVSFADHGTRDDTLAAIGSIKLWATERTAEDIAIARRFITGTSTEAERLAVAVIVGRFLADFNDMVAAWADWATTVVEEWPDDPRDAEPEWEIVRTLADRIADA